MDFIRQDFRFALRALSRSPGFTVIALLSLTLGIGANSTLFSLVNGVRYRPLPYRDEQRVVALHELCAGCSVGTSYATYLDWKADAKSYQSMGAYDEDVFALAGTEQPVRVSGGHVSASLYPLLGVSPILGRPISDEEDRQGGPPVVLLSHGLWQRAFASDSAVVGRTVRLNGVTTTVIGVMPPRFKFPENAELWAPIAPAQAGRARGARDIGVVARLKDGVTVAQAGAELAGIARGLESREPETYHGWTAGVKTVRDDLNEDSGPPFYLLLGASAFVLLIACANLANLLLARALRRERDFAVRSALGASRARVVRLLLMESLLLSIVGGALGLLVALWGVDAVTTLIPAQIPFWISFSLDVRVLAFTLAVAVGTGLAFGLMPALRMSRLDVYETLKEGHRNASATRQRGRLRGALVVSEVALALVLLAGTGLMIKTYFVSRRTDDLGFDPHGILQARVELLQHRYRDPTQVALFGSQLLGRLRSTPGAEMTALESERFLGVFVGTQSRLTVEGSAAPIPDNVVPRFARGVTPSYFELMRIPLLRGRSIVASDRPSSTPVAVVNDAAAQVLWPGQDAIGKRFSIGSADSSRWITVVGVVGNIAGAGAGRRRAAPFIYTSFMQQGTQPVTALVRTSAAPTAFAPSLRRAVEAIDPDQPVTDVKDMETVVFDWIAPVLFFVRVLGVLAVIALVLAAMGIYGVVSYAVSQRTHEIGVRVALGASSRRVMRMVVGHGVLLGAAGAALGLAGAFVATRVLQAVLYGTSPTDPLVLGVVTLVLVGVAVVASVIPARRALTVNPVEALRAE